MILEVQFVDCHCQIAKNQKNPKSQFRNPKLSLLLSFVNTGVPYFIFSNKLSGYNNCISAVFSFPAIFTK